MTEPGKFIAVQHTLMPRINPEPAIADLRGDEPQMNL
jgi:hypothetical protein